MCFWNRKRPKSSDRFLLEEIEKGNVKMKTYKQMKMYNDESLNPVLYQNQKINEEIYKFIFALILWTSCSVEKIKLISFSQ